MCRNPVRWPAVLDRVATRIPQAMQERSSRSSRMVHVNPIQAVGADNLVTSCHLGIFMDQAAEPVPAYNAHIGHFDRRIRTYGGRLLLQCPVRTVSVVVVGVLPEDQPQMPLANDEHPVQALATRAAHPA